MEGKHMSPEHIELITNMVQMAAVFGGVIIMLLTAILIALLGGK